MINLSIQHLSKNNCITCTTSTLTQTKTNVDCFTLLDGGNTLNNHLVCGSFYTQSRNILQSYMIPLLLPVGAAECCSLKTQEQTSSKAGPNCINGVRV